MNMQGTERKALRKYERKPNQLFGRVFAFQLSVSHFTHHRVKYQSQTENSTPPSAGLISVTEVREAPDDEGARGGLA